MNYEKKAKNKADELRKEIEKACGKNTLISLNKLANTSGIRLYTLTNIMKGGDPHLTTAFKIILALNDLGHDCNLLFKHQKKKVLFDFFMWFRGRGELYIHKSIEEMIRIYIETT